MTEQTPLDRLMEKAATIDAVICNEKLVPTPLQSLIRNISLHVGTERRRREEALLNLAKDSAALHWGALERYTDAQAQLAFFSVLAEYIDRWTAPDSSMAPGDLIEAMDSQRERYTEDALSVSSSTQSNACSMAMAEIWRRSWNRQGGLGSWYATTAKAIGYLGN